MRRHALEYVAINFRKRLSEVAYKARFRPPDGDICTQQQKNAYQDEFSAKWVSHRDKVMELPFKLPRRGFPLTTRPAFQRRVSGVGISIGLALAFLLAALPADAAPVFGPFGNNDRIHFRLDGDIADIALSRDGGTLAVLTTERTLRLVDCDSGEDIGSAPLDDRTGDALAMTADGSMALVGSLTDVSGQTVGELVVYSLAARRVAHLVIGPPSPFTAIAVAPSGKLVATGCQDGTVCIWDPRRWRIVKSYPAYGYPDSSRMTPAIASLAFSPDSATLVVRDAAGLRAIDPTTGKEIGSVAADVTSAAYGGAGRMLAESIWYQDSDDVSVGVLRLLQPPAMTMTHSIRLAKVSGWYLRSLTPVAGLPLVAGITDRGFAVWNTATGELVSQLYTGQIIRSMSISGDGSTFAYVDVKGFVNIMPTHALLTAHPQPVKPAANPLPIRPRSTPVLHPSLKTPG